MGNMIFVFKNTNFYYNSHIIMELNEKTVFNLNENVLFNVPTECNLLLGNSAACNNQSTLSIRIYYNCLLRYM